MCNSNVMRTRQVKYIHVMCISFWNYFCRPPRCLVNGITVVFLAIASPAGDDQIHLSFTSIWAQIAVDHQTPLVWCLFIDRRGIRGVRVTAITSLSTRWPSRYCQFNNWLDFVFSTPSKLLHPIQKMHKTEIKENHLLT